VCAAAFGRNFCLGYCSSSSSSVCCVRLSVQALLRADGRSQQEPTIDPNKSRRSTPVTLLLAEPDGTLPCLSMRERRICLGLYRARCNLPNVQEFAQSAGKIRPPPNSIFGLIFFDKIGRIQWKSVGFQKLDPIFGDIRGILEPCVPHETDGWRFSVAARFQKQLQLSSIGHLYLSDVRC
jgi:hypothetical protein